MAATLIPGKNYKGDLVIFLQRFIGRTLTKEDVVYTYTNAGDQFQAVVKLNCSDGEEFAGELCATEKEAGQAAAAQALAAFEGAAAALPPAPTRQEKTRERKNKKAQEKSLLGLEGGVKEEKTEDGGSRETNFKTELVKALQVHCKRAMTRLDVIYNTTKVGEWYQATVQLVVVQDATFAGEPCATEKAAEHSAAEQALLGRSGWPDPVPPTTLAEKIGSLGGNGALAVPGLPAQKRKGTPREAGNRKSELVIFLQGFVKRTLTKGDVVYTVNKFGSYYQATLTLPCLDGQTFEGEPCTTQKEAESSAAEQALLAYAEHVQAVPALRRIAEGGPSVASSRGPASKRQRLQTPTAAWPAFAVAAIRPARPGGLGMGVPMFSVAQKGPLAAGPRTAVVGLPITGTVTDWNSTGSWGYVRPDVPINHPQALIKGGKIYVHKQDLANAAELPIGSRVHFKVYEDARGLGANDVVVVL